MSQRQDLKARRKARNHACEVQLQRVFSDFSRSPGDQAVAGLEILSEKVTEDLTEQLEGVQRSSAADRELRRLLRMLEKRKKQLDKMYAAVSLDDDLMAAASSMILQWNHAEN